MENWELNLLEKEKTVALEIWEMPSDRNPVLVYLASLSKGSRRSIKQSLEKALKIIMENKEKISPEFFPWHKIEYQHLQAIRSHLEGSVAPSTGNKVLSAVRGVLKECWQLGYISGEVYQRAKSVPRIKGNSLPSGRALEQNEVLALINACDENNGPTGTRDKAIIGVLYNCGLRRSELVGLNLENYDEETGEIRILQGKGNKSRTVFISNACKEALDKWRGVRGGVPGSLFTRIRKWDTLTLDKLTDQAVLYILQKRAKQAGVKNLSPHDFRRTMISTLLDKGVDIVTIQKMAGHSNPNTTAKYDRRGEQAKKKASELMGW